MKRILACTLVLCLLLCGCKKEDDSKDSDIQTVYGGVLNISMETTDTLDPLLAKHRTVRDCLFAVYEPLIAVNEKLELRGVLAEGWSFNGDCTALTVNLRRGVHWHDGSDFKAEDVIYSVEAIRRTPDSPYYDMLRYVSSVAKLDPYTVCFYLSRSYSQLTYSLYFPIISSGAGDLTTEAVGTGPFMFESYNPGRDLQLVRNDAYRDGEAGFDKISVNIVKEKVSAASSFSKGVSSALQGDIYFENDTSGLNKNTVSVACGGWYEYIGLNQHRPVFSSATVRGALSGAIDRNEIVSDGYVGACTATNLPMHPLAERFAPSRALTEYSLAAASESLFYDGWSDQGGEALVKSTVEYSGVDEDGEAAAFTAEDVSLDFSLLVNTENPRRLIVADIVASQLSKAGFKVNVVKADFDSYLERIESGDYDAYIGGTQLGNLYDLEFLLSQGGSQNYFGYASESMDKALEAVASAASDADFVSACTLVQEIFVRDQPVVGLAFLDESIVLSDNISGDTKPMYGSAFGNVKNWYFLK